MQRLQKRSVKLDEDRRQMVLDLAKAVLTNGGPDAAVRFAATADRVRTLDLEVVSTGGGPCGVVDSPYQRLIPHDDGCYLVSTDAPDPLVSYRFAPIMLGLAVLASTVRAAALLARNLVNPVIQLRDGLRALADGRFDVRIAGALAHREDEISTLAVDFDRTALRLKENHEAQQRLFHDLPGTFLAEVDGELVYRALENVIRNAARHSTEGSQVTVTSTAAEDTLSIEVTDAGPGVRPEDLELIFHPFTRGSEAAPRGGYGLGLAIARRAIERHGGAVRADLPPGGGLRIVPELPQTPARRSPIGHRHGAEGAARPT